MYVGNGEIYDSISSALIGLQEQGYNDLKKIEIDVTSSMTYFINPKGDLFGMQRYKNFFLVKKKVVESNSMGCFIRLVKQGKHEWRLYLAPLLFRMFVDPDWDNSGELVFKDGNVHNYQLSNLSVKKKEVPKEYLHNMDSFKNVYKSLFSRCSDHIQYTIGISKADSEDAASVSFFELCKSWDCSNSDESYFARCWFKRGEKRGIDYYSRSIKYGGRVLFDDGEEIFGNSDRRVEVADFWSPLKNFPTSIKYLKLRLNGYSNVEIGKMYGISSGTVGGSVSRALTLLKDHFKNDVLFYCN